MKFTTSLNLSIKRHIRIPFCFLNTIFYTQFYNTSNQILIMKKFYFHFFTLMLVLFTLASCSGNTSKNGVAEELSGSGATFPLPFYNVLFENYNVEHDTKVAYGGIGSGGGIRNLRDGIIDFAGTDAYISDEEVSGMKPVVHIPTCMGAVVVAYNLKDIDNLVLSGDVIADIFAGKIKKWNDPRISALNKDIKLPEQNIMPVYRSDGSGTTFVFTDYLCKVSKDWADTYGKGKSVNFPYGQAAKGNPGVAGIISQTQNSIGYIGSEYAFAQNIPYATIINANNEAVKPTVESISSAAKGKIPADTRTMITNSSAPGAYPISCFTWIVVYKEQNYSHRNLGQAKATVDFLKYIISPKAQQIASKVHYAPLPQEVVELSMANIQKITYNNNPLK